jgi:hypothetical protein
MSDDDSNNNELNKIIHEQAIDDLLDEDESTSSSSISSLTDSETSGESLGDEDEEDAEEYEPPSVSNSISSSFRQQGSFSPSTSSSMSSFKNTPRSPRGATALPAIPSAPKPNVSSNAPRLKPPPKSAPPVIDERTIFKEGYLMKEGYRVKSWKNRYFVVRKNRLQYFSKKGGSLKGEISTDGAIIRECPERKIPHCFKIETKDRIWYIQVPQSTSLPSDTLRDTMFSWFDAITTYGGAIERLPDVDKDEETSDISSDSDLSSDMDDDDIKRVKSSQLLEDDSKYYDTDDENLDHSDDEIWDVLSNSRQIQKAQPSQQERRVNEKRAISRAHKAKQEKQEREAVKRKHDEEEKKRAEQQRVKNLFGYFAQKSEKQQMTKEDVLDAPVLREDGELQQSKGAKTPFGNISILSSKQDTKVTKVDAEKLKHHMRRQRFIKTFADGAPQQDDLAQKGESFRDLVDDDEDEVLSTGKKSAGDFWNYFSACYKDYRWFSHFLLFSCGFAFFALVTCLIFFRTDLAFSKYLFKGKSY